MKEYNFDTREEAINFLDKHNFKYYIPRVCEYMSNIKDELKAYCVELSDSHEVTRCWIVSITDGKKYREIFFDIVKNEGEKEEIVPSERTASIIAEIKKEFGTKEGNQEEKDVAESEAEDEDM